MSNQKIEIPKNALEEMYPKREFSLSDSPDSFKIIIKAIALPDIPKAIGVLMSLQEKLAGKNVTQELLFQVGLEEIFKLLPLCCNVPLEAIPGTLMPDVVMAVVDLNLSESVLKKWGALITKIHDVGSTVGVFQTGSTAAKPNVQDQGKLFSK